MTPHLIALVALLVIPFVALGSAMLAERLIGPRTGKKRRARGRPRAGWK